MSENIKILLAEDDENLGYILLEYLKMNGYQVDLVRDGEEGFSIFESSRYDLCILDIMMPKKDGFTLASEIKEIDPEVPVIFLTAKGLKIDKLKGFKIGADDYIVKPVDEEELIARIEAIIRRYKPLGNTVEKEKFSIGHYTFDFKNQWLLINDEKQTLTVKEAEILRALCKNKGQLLERKVVLNELWNGNDYFNRRSMDVFISRLRKYLAKDHRIDIRNVHGKGFILEVGE